MLMALMLSVTPNATLAQTVTYAYDASGNRITRTIVLSGNKTLEVGEDNEVLVENPFDDSDFFEDVVSEQRFRIYPNPTHGLLKIDFQNISNNDRIRIEVYDLRGSVIKTIPQAQITNTIDLSSEPNGVYLFLIMYGTEHKSWKIIKN